MNLRCNACGRIGYHDGNRFCGCCGGSLFPLVFVKEEGRYYQATATITIDQMRKLNHGFARFWDRHGVVSESAVYDPNLPGPIRFLYRRQDGTCMPLRLKPLVPRDWLAIPRALGRLLRRVYG